jgi:hypothetical protein
MTPHALIVKGFSSFPGNVTSGAIARPRRQAHILMAPDALAMKSLGPAGHGFIVNAGLVAITAMGRAFISHVVAVGAIESEIHAVGVMIEFPAGAQGRYIFRLDLMAIAARYRQGRIVVIGMMAVTARQAVTIHMDLMVKQDLPGGGLKHQTDRRFRRFRRQRAV